MKIIKKITILIILLSLLLSLTSCAGLYIDAVITNTNYAYLKYTLTVNTTNQSNDSTTSVRNTLKEIQNYWDGFGYETTLKNDSGLYTITCVMVSEEQGSRKDALIALSELMSNEVSVFDNVTYDYIDEYYYDIYSIAADIDLSTIINSDTASYLPQSALDDLDEYMDTLECYVNMTFPDNYKGTKKVSNNKYDEVQISTEKPDNIYFSTYNFDVKKYDNFIDITDKKIAQIQLIEYIAYGLGLLLILLVILFLLIVLIKPKPKPKTAKQKQKHFKKH